MGWSEHAGQPSSQKYNISRPLYVSALFSPFNIPWYIHYTRPKKTRIHEYRCYICTIHIPLASHQSIFIHTYPWKSINPCISQYPDKYILNTVRASHSTTIYRDYTPWYPHDILKNLLYPNHMHTKTNQTNLIVYALRNQNLITCVCV